MDSCAAQQVLEQVRIGRNGAEVGIGVSELVQPVDFVHEIRTNSAE